MYEMFREKSMYGEVMILCAGVAVFLLISIPSRD